MIGDKVYTKKYRGNDWKWVPGTVLEREGEVTYKISTAVHGIIRSHADQMRLRTADYTTRDTEQVLDIEEGPIVTSTPEAAVHPELGQNTELPISPILAPGAPDLPTEHFPITSTPLPAAQMTNGRDGNETPTPRRSTRLRRRQARLEPYEVDYLAFQRIEEREM